MNQPNLKQDHLNRKAAVELVENQLNWIRWLKSLSDHLLIYCKGVPSGLLIMIMLLSAKNNNNKKPVFLSKT